MNNNVPQNGLGGFLQSVLGGITAIIGLLTSLVGFIKLVQGDTGLATKVLLIVGILFLWLTCAYFYWKPAPKAPAGFPQPTSSEQRKRVRQRKSLALVGMFTIAIVSVTGLYGWQQYQSRPSDKIIVLVANFKSLQSKEYGVTEQILNQLRRATRKYSDVKIQPLNKPITEQEGSEVARKEGKKSKASIVIWGWYGVEGDKVPVSANFEVLNPPKQLPKLGQTASGRVQTPAIAELKSFKLQTRLSNEMAYLSLFTLGMTRYTASDWDGAIARFSDALSQTAESTPVLERSIVYFYRGIAYVYKGDYDRAIGDYNLAIQLNPDEADAYYNRGIAYVYKGDYDRAIADYNLAIKLNPDEDDAYNNRGIAYRNKGDYDRAIADYNLAIKLNPNNADAYYNRGIAYRNKGNYDRAIADYNLAIKLNPDEADAYNSRGFAYVYKGDYDRAIADFNLAIKLNPDDDDAYNNRGIAYSYKGDYDRAIADYNLAIKLNPNDADAYYDRGFAYRKKGDKNEAIANFKKTLELTKEQKMRQNAEKHLQEIGVK